MIAKNVTAAVTTNVEMNRAMTPKIFSLFCLDCLFFEALVGAGMTWHHAHIASFLSAGALLMLWKRLRVTHSVSNIPFTGPIAIGSVIQLCALFLRGGALATAIEIWGVPSRLAILIGSVFSAMVVFYVPYMRSRLYTFGHGSSLKEIGENGLCLAIVGYLLLLRLSYSGPFELLHEEGYYWCYAQHLDIGYLDHPPMVGWLIWFFTALGGHTEFVMRGASLLCWVVTAFYVYRLSFAIGGKTTACRALLLVALLPVYFALGLVILPDTPLIACWAGALFYLYRALIEEQKQAWLGVGTCMGLGLLSKYTMVLLGGATMISIVADPRFRKWITHPAPYLAAGLAMVIFTPVIIWNAQHGWASFYMQSVARATGAFNFGLQDLVGSALILLTPTGLLCIVAMVVARKRIADQVFEPKIRKTFGLFIYLTALPVAVFFFFSFFKLSKLNWTAPIWLGTLPLMAMFINPLGIKANRPHQALAFLPRAWPVTVMTLLVLYGALLHYLTLGFPGVAYPKGLEIGKRSLARQTALAREVFAQKTDAFPLVVCMQDERLAGWLAYYLSLDADKWIERGYSQIIKNTTAAHYFGEDSQMFRYWRSLDEFNNRVILLVGPKRHELENQRILSKAVPLSEIKEIIVRQKNKITGRYYYRFLHTLGGDSWMEFLLRQRLAMHSALRLNS